MKFEITNLSTGKTRTIDLDFKSMGKKSVKARHAKFKNDKEKSEYYSRIRKGIKQ